MLYSSSILSFRFEKENKEWPEKSNSYKIKPWQILTTRCILRWANQKLFLYIFSNILSKSQCLSNCNFWVIYINIWFKYSRYTYISVGLLFSECVVINSLLSSVEVSYGCDVKMKKCIRQNTKKRRKYKLIKV